ncbi:flagellar protein FliT [Pseudescherichia sp. L3]|uniref:flagellar protein FliT n=1 Tax=Pseudescherichia sp. L3 TaxID=2970817 RepID=UPI00214FB0D4|nr:flagellar protein FliT [Pseudescherichia sp. L3]MCR4456412.1 flagellar protein FliT [Pseudescherichia sp. L3]
MNKQIDELLSAMDEALNKQRWRRMPALHTRLMTLFNAYCESQPPQDELEALKARLRQAYGDIIARRTERVALLQTRMEKHRQQREGVLAYSLMNTVSEQP